MSEEDKIFIKRLHWIHPVNLFINLTWYDREKMIEEMEAKGKKDPFVSEYLDTFKDRHEYLLNTQ